jgi:hypothetical protein
MAAKVTLLGNGTLKLGTVPTDFSGEVLGAKITHEYNEVGEARTMLDGTVRPASVQRADGFTASIENDLTAAGLYAYLDSNDQTEVALEFVPNTANGAEWAGTVQIRLPSEVGADEYGTPIVSDVELPGVGEFTFTPGT